MTLIIRTFEEYFEYRQLIFSLTFDDYRQCQPLLNGDVITMEELYEDYLEFMEGGSNAPIRFWV